MRKCVPSVVSIARHPVDGADELILIDPSELCNANNTGSCVVGREDLCEENRER
jgi:hypothetical protein